MSVSRGYLQNFTEGDFVFVARDAFHVGEELALSGCGPRRITNELSEYVFTVDDLLNGSQVKIHGSSLKFCSNGSLDTDIIISRVLYCETTISVSTLLKFLKITDRILVQVRWKGQTHSDDTVELWSSGCKDVPQMPRRFPGRKKFDSDLANKSRLVLAL